jgi:DNA-directed RNA polymerase subunit RPC12/RpoP
MALIICPECGQQYSDSAICCPRCGYRARLVQYRNNPASVGLKNKYVAIFLCLFGGFLGLHKFYEGKPFQGILYIFTLGIFGAGWIFDLLLLLFSTPKWYKP